MMKLRTVKGKEDPEFIKSFPASEIAAQINASQSSSNSHISTSTDLFRIQGTLKPLWDIRDDSVPPQQQPVKLQGAKFKTTEIPQL